MKPRIRVEFNGSQIREIVKQYLENNFTTPGPGAWNISGGHTVITADFEYAPEEMAAPAEESMAGAALAKQLEEAL